MSSLYRFASMEEAADEILRLRSEIKEKDKIIGALNGELLSADDIIEDQHIAIVKLKSAIKPFADMIREVSDLHEDHDRVEECNELTAGDIRRAADVLKGMSDD